MSPINWLLRLVRRRELSQASHDEMRFHVETEVADLMRRGMPEAEARRRTRLTLGDVEVEVERLGDRRPGVTFENLRRDVRVALRSLGRAPTLVIVTVLLVALGVAASTSIFTLVDRVLLRPLPLPDADRIVRLHEASPVRGIAETGVSRGNLAEWRIRSRSFEALAVAYTVERTITEGDRSDMVSVAQVSCDFFPVLGLRPRLGSVFTDDQCRAARFNPAAAPISSDPVVVLAHRYWMDRLGGDRDVIGRTIGIDRRPFRVIGVMPANATVVTPGVAAFLAWELEASLPYDQRYASAFGRLRPEVSLDAARADVDRIAGELARERPQTNRDWTVTVTTVQDAAVRGLRPILVTLLVAAGVLLCIACANVALLLSARGLARAHEASLHLALGGSPGRLLRQGLIEAGLLAGGGGLLGTVASFGIVGYLRSAWFDLPRASEVAPDAWVIAFAIGATVLAAALAGLLPALRHARSQPIDALRGGRRATGGNPSGRGRDALVMVEVALTAVLLAGAGLLVRSVNELRAQHPGFDARDVTVVPVFLDSEQYRTGAASRAYYAELFARLRALPGVVAVGGSTTLPTSVYGPDFARPVWPASRAGDERAIRPASVRIVTPGYFEALRIPIVRGRAFDERDGPDGPRVIAVSQRLARTLWPDRNPLGEHLVVDYATAGTYPYEVVGVIGDLRFGGPRSEPLEEVYFPHAQRSYLILNVAVRGRPGASPSVATIQGTMRALDPQKPPQGVYPLDDLLAATYRRDHWAMQLLIGFAGAAALLATLGIYGMIAYRVREARREIGVRLALGATAATVIRWVAGQVGRVLAVGAIAGIATAAIVARFLGALLYGVPPHDPWTALGVLGMLGAIGAVASCLPAWRAARVDPATALRVD